MTGASKRGWALLAAGALIASSVAACRGSSAPRPAAASLKLKPCVTAGVSARCGSLVVPQDRTSGTGPTIPVRVVVIPAKAEHLQRDPIVWFAGGPGDSAVDMVGRVRPLFGSVADRELVFIEQRGTGASNVTCPSLPGLDDKAALDKAAASCLHGLKVDLRDYTTAAYADDVDQVLTALGFDTVNLTGISYGTTAEQVFLARHPQRVRSMTLLSGTLLTVPAFELMPRNTQLALDAVFAECADETSCHAAFPRLTAEWATLWRSVSQQPLVVPADRSPSHERLVLDANWFAGEIHQLLMVAGTQAAIPVIVHTLATAGDQVSALLALAAAMPPGAQSTDSRTQMMPFAVQCNEQWALRDPARLVGTDSFDYQNDLASARWWQYVCGLMPQAQEPGDAAHLANANVAVLALNGTVDPQDPPGNMTGAAELWPNQAFLQVPGQGHDIDPAQSGACVSSIMQTFIEHGSTAELDVGCLQRLSPPKFPLTVHALSEQFAQSAK